MEVAQLHNYHGGPQNDLRRRRSRSRSDSRERHPHRHDANDGYASSSNTSSSGSSRRRRRRKNRRHGRPLSRDGYCHCYHPRYVPLLPESRRYEEHRQYVARFANEIVHEQYYAGAIVPMQQGYAPRHVEYGSLLPQPGHREEGRQDRPYGHAPAPNRNPEEQRRRDRSANRRRRVNERERAHQQNNVDQRRGMEGRENGQQLVVQHHEENNQYHYQQQYPFYGNMPEHRFPEWPHYYNGGHWNQWRAYQNYGPHYHQFDFLELRQPPGNMPANAYHPGHFGWPAPVVEMIDGIPMVRHFPMPMQNYVANQQPPHNHQYYQDQYHQDHHYVPHQDHHDQDYQHHHHQNRQDRQDQLRQDHHYQNHQDRQDHHHPPPQDHHHQNRQNHQGLLHQNHHDQDRQPHQDHHHQDRQRHHHQDHQDRHQQGRQDHHHQDRQDHQGLLHQDHHYRDRQRHHRQDHQDRQQNRPENHIRRILERQRALHRQRLLEDNPAPQVRQPAPYVFNEEMPINESFLLWFEYHLANHFNQNQRFDVRLNEIVLRVGEHFPVPNIETFWDDLSELHFRMIGPDPPPEDPGSPDYERDEDGNYVNEPIAADPWEVEDAPEEPERAWTPQSPDYDRDEDGNYLEREPEREVRFEDENVRERLRRFMQRYDSAMVRENMMSEETYMVRWVYHRRQREEQRQQQLQQQQQQLQQQQ